MNRGQKKFLYGLFYIIVFGLLVWAFIPSSSMPIAGLVINNAGQPLPLQLVGAPYIFKSVSADRIVLFARIKNPNADYGAENFPYVFSISDKNGNVLNQFSDTDKILPSESRYVIYNFDVNNQNLFQSATGAALEFGDIRFVSADKFLAPEVSVVSEPEVSAGASEISIVFTVKNQSVFPIAAVKAVGLVENEYNDPIFAGETLIQNLSGLEERQISIFLPADPVLVRETSARKPVILLNGE